MAFQALSSASSPCYLHRSLSPLLSWSPISSYSTYSFCLPKPPRRLNPIRAQLTSHANSNLGESRWSLCGMTALVTGGTRGIGHAIVKELSGFGAKVHTCSRNESELNECLSHWEDLGFLVTGSVCDVSVRDQREALMDRVSSVFDGKLNILVNNAGTNIRKPTVEFTEDDLSLLMTTNFESVFHLSQLAYPLLKASGVGSIVFMSSVAGFVSLKSMSIQGAAKGAINQLTKYLACEWAKDNIRSNAVAPWYIKTSMVEQVLKNVEYTQEIYSRTPLRRLGETNEVSSLVAFLSLPASSYITGQIICVDGGIRWNWKFWPAVCRVASREEVTDVEIIKAGTLQRLRRMHISSVITGKNEQRKKIRWARLESKKAESVCLWDRLSPASEKKRVVPSTKEQIAQSVTEK